MVDLFNRKHNKSVEVLDKDKKGIKQNTSNSTSNLNTLRTVMLEENKEVRQVTFAT